LTLRYLINAARLALTSLRNNPDYAGTIAVGYGMAAFQIMVQLVLLPLYITILGKFDFGVLMVLLAFANSARLGLSWLYGRMLRVLGKAYTHSDRTEYARASNVFRIVYIGYGLFAAAALCAIGLLMPTLLVGSFADGKEDMLRAAFLIMALYVALINWLTVEAALLTARKRQALSQVSQIVSLAVFVVLVVPVLLLGGGLDQVVICLVVGAAAAILFCLFFSFLDNWGALGKGPGWLFADVSRYARPQIGRYGLYGLLFLLLQSDTMLVGIIGGAENVAEFVLVWKIAEVIILLMWRLCESLQPEIINMDMTGDYRRVERLYARGIKLMLLMGLIAAAAYGIFGEFLVHLWVGPEMAPSNSMAFTLAGAAIFWMVAARFPSVLAYSLGQLKLLNMIAGVEVVARIFITIALFSTLSFLAPLVAINITHVFGIAIAYFILGRRCSREHPQHTAMDK
jgi:O-antigen/teichoic acid export membrane protein